MRIMIYSTAPWGASGYATIARGVGPILRDMGHAVAFHAWNTVRGGIMEYDGMPVYPAGQTRTSLDVLAGHIKHFRADILLTICDPWIVEDPYLWSQNHSARVVHWHPCQSSPCGRPLASQIMAADLGLNYSAWGTEQVRAAGVTNVRHVPLGVNLDVFHPLDGARDWLSGKLKVDLSSRFVVTMVAANASTLPIMRKNFDGQLRAFARFKREVPDAIMYLHTNCTGIPSGFDLRTLLAVLGLEIGRDVFFPPYWNYTLGMDDTWINRVLNASDVLSAASLGEGFGLPILEAHAAGLPVVATNASSMPELVKFGHLARVVAHQWCPEPMEGFAFVPSEDDILNGYRAAYRSEMPIGSRTEALDFANQMSWVHIVRDRLEPALREVMA